MIIGKGLYTKKYQIYSPKLPLSFDGFKFIFISDLHGKIYGKENTTLIQLINKANPDCILIGGDMMVGGENPKYEFGYSPISAKSVDISVDLISKLSKKYTIIHALGNHEEKLHSELWRKYTEALKEFNVKLIDNDVHRFINDDEEQIDIYGLSLGREFYPKFKRKELDVRNITDKIGTKGENYSILMAHSPVYFSAYSKWGADLTLSGHLHGGIMRLPFVGGVIGPDFFILPKYSGGLYKENNRNMIVSCGVGMHTVNLRIFNPPELTLVELRFGEKLNGN